MSIRFTIVLLIVLGLFAQCKNGVEKQANTNQAGYLIQVSVKDHSPNRLILLSKIKNNQPVVIDSVTTNAEGKAEISGSLKTPGFYLLNVQGQREGLIILDNDTMEVVLDNTNDTTEPYITGSALMDQYNQINEFQKQYEQIIYTNQIQMAAVKRNNAQPSEIAALEARNVTALEEVQANIKNFLRKQNPPSIVTIYAASSLDINKDFAFLDSMNRVLKQKYPDNDDIISFAEFLGKYANIVKGAEAPAFTQNTPEGKPFTLASLRGKYVLIDFWASWCGPCRRANPDLVKTYEKFKGPKFEILGVSLDKDAEAWKKAIKDDKLTWLHVSDLNYWENEVARKYQVESIPTSFLLDPQGKIIGRDLGHEDLENILSKALK